MAATDARPVPRKNIAYRVTFPILDADGDLVTGATALDSEVSIDGGTFADATSEATEIATSSGVYFLDLTAGEMNGDTVAVIIKTSTAGAKTTTIVMYPEEAGDYRADVVQWLGTAAATPTVAGVPEVDVTHVAGTAQTAGDIMADTNDIQTRLPAALVGGRMDASVGAIAANAVTAAALAADAGAEIADAVWDEDATGHQTLGTYGQAIGDPVADTSTIYGAVVTGAAGVDIAADIVAVKADTAAILVDTGTTLDGRIPAALVSGRMDSDIRAINGNTVAATVLAILNGATVVYQGTVTGAATTTTLIDSGLTQADTDWWKGRIIIFTSVITLQATDITGFAPGTDTLTFTAVTAAPTGATYVII